jgi:hypothetical protein
VGRYLDVADAVPRKKPAHRGVAPDEPTYPKELEPGTDTEAARRLLEAGWKPKASFGRVIWERPDTGFWVSQEVALYFLESKNIRGGAAE